MAVLEVVHDLLQGEVQVPLVPPHCHFSAPLKVVVVYLEHQECFVLMNSMFFYEAGLLLEVELSHLVVQIHD